MEIKMHGLFLTDADIDDVYREFCKAFPERIDPDPDPEDRGWEGYWTIYNLVPFVTFLDERLERESNIPIDRYTDWEITYSYPPIETVSYNGIFIDAKGKTDDDFISWLEHYLGGTLNIDWKVYISDCDIYFSDEWENYISDELKEMCIENQKENYENKKETYFNQNTKNSEELAKYIADILEGKCDHECYAAQLDKHGWCKAYGNAKMCKVFWKEHLEDEVDERGLTMMGFYY